MDLNTIWFILIGFFITGYAILDGFDLGVGILSLFARDRQERRIHLKAIGPVWDGNEVWLITAGAALFAAFPVVYATVFSGFYLAFMLLLVALIARAVSLEFRGKIESSGWQRFWDGCFGIGSLLLALLFGVAVGNVLRGVPVESDGSWAGSFPGLLNTYSLLVGLLSVIMFTMHGSIYLALKTEGSLQDRLSRWITVSWAIFVLVYLMLSLLTMLISKFLFDHLTANPLFWILSLLLLVGILSIPMAVRKRDYFRSFLASSLTIACVIGLAAVSLYPRIVPSGIDLANSLTIYNASSSPRSLEAMLIIALIGTPIMLGYTICVYRVFRGKVKLEEAGY